MTGLIIYRQISFRMLCVAITVTLTAQGLCQQTPAPRLPKTFYVNTCGNELNDGSAPGPAKAFRKVQTGINHLKVPGDSLKIAGGTYTEFVYVRGKTGSPEKPIVIEGMDGEVIIQGCITTIGGSTDSFNFHNAPNHEWQLDTSSGANAEEYVSVKPFPKPSGRAAWHVSRGAFIHYVSGRYTRLITYSRLEDLRSENETYERILEGTCRDCVSHDPRSGPILNKTDTSVERRPWVYMGPGVWFDSATSKVHIRLSPTHDSVPGLTDYSGSADPNMVALSIAEEGMKTLIVQNSSYLQLRNLSICFGGETIRVQGSNNISFDEITIRAGQYGVRTEKAPKLKFLNSIFDGGLPTWMFRNDLKDNYRFLRGNDTLKNNLGKNTMETLFLGNNFNDSTQIEYCEFINAHDLYLGGRDFNFHHNWISNLHDEGLFLDAAAIASGSVHHNVLVQVLSAISLAGGNVAGPWHIYRNLVDLRKPTAGFRPQHPGSDRAKVWRAGHPFKSNGVNGPFDLFQNTFIVPLEVSSAINHLRSSTPAGNRRRSYNNIFVVFNDAAHQDRSVAFLPPVDFPAEVNGNLYYKKGYGTSLFYIPAPGGFRTFKCGTDENCIAKWHLDSFFKKTQISSPPGYEANSILFSDPQFVNWTGEPRDADDFRLKPNSPARLAGVQLPTDLLLLDPLPVGSNYRDIGCYQSLSDTLNAAKLAVGVRGRKLYPTKEMPLNKSSYGIVTTILSQEFDGP